jgi:RND family efflux transporter MFP subunit
MLVAAGLAALLVVGFMGRGREVVTVTARRGSAAEVVYATGNVEPVTWAKVTALSRKRIVEICKCEGQEVKKGDVLARLDDVEERAVLTELEARLARLKDDAERMTTLVQRNISPKAQLDEKLTQIREQQARLAAQQDRIADLSLKAPLDGVVLRRDGEIGEMAGIGSSDTLLWIGQPKPLQIVAEVNEDDILRVAKGQKALLRHEGHTSGPLEGQVLRITPKGDPQSKTFRVYIALPDDTPLKIGMSVEANIVVAEIADAVVLPAEALGDHKVLRIESGRVAPVPVEVGIRSTSSVEIRSGIAAGDVIVSPYLKDLKAGALVRASEAKRP